MLGARLAIAREMKMRAVSIADLWTYLVPNLLAALLKRVYFVTGQLNVLVLAVHEAPAVKVVPQRLHINWIDDEVQMHGGDACQRGRVDANTGRKRVAE